jgi:hypothetical protein
MIKYEILFFIILSTRIEIEWASGTLALKTFKKSHLTGTFAFAGQ